MTQKIPLAKALGVSPAARLGVALPGAVRWSQAQELARRAEAAGCDAVWVFDVRREPYLTSAAALAATRTIQVGTNVAVAFPRSPSLTATAAWDLAEMSGGRFLLGLGSSVKGLLEARYGISADRPAPRLKDYVAAVRSCLDAYGRGYGGYQGPFYQIRRPVFQPGGEPAHLVPIYLAGVNPIMIRTAGECGDGLAAHSFTTSEYMLEVVRPALSEGARRAGRPAPPLLLQIVVAGTREQAAAQMGAYTVPSYRRVLDHSGLGHAADAVALAMAGGQRAEARALVDQHLVDRLAVIVGDDLDAGLAGWLALADRICLSVPWYGLDGSQQVTATERLIGLIGSFHARAP